MEWFIASDHAGFDLKKQVLEKFDGGVDLGPMNAASVDYPDFAHALAKIVLQKPGTKGILICGSGIGMSITANRHPGIRAALCYTPEAARLSRQHNDANVLCLGARMVDSPTCLKIVSEFFDTEFESGRHAKRVHKIEQGDSNGC